MTEPSSPNDPSPTSPAAASFVDARPSAAASSSEGDPAANDPGSANVLGSPTMPDYKGAPLDSERGPGLGCFWFQVGMLVLLLVLTPISVWLSAPSWLSAALLIIVLILLFFVGQTMIFLLRLVAADRRTRRRPLAQTARQTVGQIEEQAAAPALSATESAPPMAAPPTAAPRSHEDDATPDEPLT